MGPDGPYGKTTETVFIFPSLTVAITSVRDVGDTGDDGGDGVCVRMCVCMWMLS